MVSTRSAVRREEQRIAFEKEAQQDGASNVVVETIEARNQMYENEPGPSTTQNIRHFLLTSSIAARKKRLEFEAAKAKARIEMNLIEKQAKAKARIEMNLIEKKLEADIADLEDEGRLPSQKSQSENDQKIESWIANSQQEYQKSQCVTNVQPPAPQEVNLYRMTAAGPLPPATENVLQACSTPAATRGTDETVQALASALKDQAAASTGRGTNAEMINRLPRELPKYSRSKRKIFWSDSSTVLAWIRNTDRTYKQFVAHRLSEIDELTNTHDWRYVPTKLNIADVATRESCEINKLQNEWFYGPSFLYEDEPIWPKESVYQKPEVNDEDLELVNVIQATHASLPVVPEPYYMLCFIARCRKAPGVCADGATMERAENLLLKYAQMKAFPDDLHNLQQNKRVKIQLSRRVGGAGGADASAFQKNCVSKEQQLTEALRRSLPGITYVSVQDISGGCGAMFEVSIEAKEFSGLNTVKQHRLVTNSLKSEIAEMHGIRIHTSPSPKQD